MADDSHPDIFIAIAGPQGSGKDTAGNYLAERYGMQHVSASDVLRAEARAKKFDPPYDRELLGWIGDRLENDFGPGPISRRALVHYANHKHEFPGGLVLSSVGRMAEVARIKDNGGIIVYIDAQQDIRFERCQNRMREDHTSREVWLQREQAEMEGSTEAGHDGMWLQGVRDHADLTLENNDSTKEFQRALDALMIKLQTKLQTSKEEVAI